jgi:phosphopantetheinyl transferase (holo-ACP synthase)
MSWILPPSKEQQEAQDRQHAEIRSRQQKEWAKKHAAKEAWLKASTCPHCGQHPPIPPWFVGY